MNPVCPTPLLTRKKFLINHHHENPTELETKLLKKRYHGDVNLELAVCGVFYLNVIKKKEEEPTIDYQVDRARMGLITINRHPKSSPKNSVMENGSNFLDKTVIDGPIWCVSLF